MDRVNGVLVLMGIIAGERVDTEGGRGQGTETSKIRLCSR